MANCSTWRYLINRCALKIKCLIWKTFSYCSTTICRHMSVFDGTIQMSCGFAGNGVSCWRFFSLLFIFNTCYLFEIPYFIYVFPSLPLWVLAWLWVLWKSTNDRHLTNDKTDTWHLTLDKWQTYHLTRVSLMVTLVVSGLKMC